MKAVTCHGGELAVADLPAPRPGKGQLLLDVRACGICGSDLHARTHADELADAASASGYTGLARSGDTVVFGHEFCGEVVERGKGAGGPKPGTLAVAFPLLRAAGAVHAVGLSPHAPGAYAEQVVTEASLTLPVPNGLPAAHAALTEPMAVAWHAVRRGQVKKGQTAVVIGCGPIGLAVIAMLKASGVRHVVASDFSPGRRALAATMGADLVVDPAAESPYATLADRYLDGPQLFEKAVSTMELLRKVPGPLPWWHVFKAADAVGALPTGPVVFECVGVPGVIDDIIASAPLASRVVVVGVCMAADTIRPATAINKEIDLRFVLGYTPDEFRDALHMLADGKVDPAPLITDTVGLDGVAGAFDALRDPERHAKILIDPFLTPR